MHDDARDRKVVRDFVRHRPIAHLAVVATFVQTARPAFDEGNTPGGWCIMLFLEHRALAPDACQLRRNGTSCVGYAFLWVWVVADVEAGRGGVIRAERFATVVVGIGSWAVKIRRQVRFRDLNCSSRFLLVVLFLVDI